MSTDPKPKNQSAAALATQTLYDQHSAMLKNYARRLVSRSNGSGESAFDEDDIAQETWARAFKHFGKGKTVDYPKGFLCKTARNVAFSMFKRSRKHIETDAKPDMDAFADAHVNSPEQLAIMRQQIFILRELRKQLPDKYMKPFMLARVFGMSYDEIAKTLGISKRAVPSRVSRGCSMVIKCSEELGIELDKLYKR